MSESDNGENKQVVDAVESSEVSTEAAAKVRHKGIYLLPNLFTTGSLFSGFYAIVAAMNGHFDNAAIAIYNAQLYDEVQRANIAKSEFVSFVAHELKKKLESEKDFQN